MPLRDRQTGFLSTDGVMGGLDRLVCKADMMCRFSL